LISQLYNFGILIYELIFSFVGLWHVKAKKIKKGRKAQWATLHTWRAEDPGPLVWFHVASLGEYEAASIFINEIIDKTNKSVLVSFYSPSGYENYHPENPRIQKAYLPKDTRTQMSSFLDLIRPESVVFVKYEFWYNLLEALSIRNIPFYYVDFKAKSLGFASNFKGLTKLEKLGFNPIQFAPDPSKIKVNQNKEKTLPSLDYLASLDGDIFVFGSVYEKDIPLIKDIIEGLPSWLFVVAPHEIDPKNIGLFSTGLSANSYQSKEDRLSNSNRILLLDTIGELKHVYQYASASYVGGSESNGYHNYHEAAVHGIPVFHKTSNQVLMDGLTFGVSQSKEIIAPLENLLHVNFKQNNIDIVMQHFGLNMDDYALMMNQLLGK